MSKQSPLRFIPNIITLFRFVLILPIGYFLWQTNFFFALLLFVIAGLSDGIDGFFARQFNWTSRFGAIADPLADKALLMTTYLLLSYHNHIPMWLTGLVIIRDITILTGGITYHNLYGAFKLEPSLLGKISTVCQISLATVVLFSISIYSLAPIVIQFFVFLVAVAGILSGADYVINWSKKARLAKAQKSHRT